jgi:uncharacterized membrane protein HdeD (DUF308 family)
MATTMKSDPLSENKADITQMFMFLGIALIIIGSISVLFGLFSTIASVVIFGGILLAAGITEMIHAIRARKKQKVGLNILSSLVYLIAGALLLWNPLLGAISLTLVISAYLFAAGIMRIVTGVKRRKEPLWGWFIADGVINLLLGAIIALGWPFTGLWVIGLFVGIEMITHGIAWVALAAAFNETEKSSPMATSAG